MRNCGGRIRVVDDDEEDDDIEDDDMTPIAVCLSYGIALVFPFSRAFSSSSQ